MVFCGCLGFSRLSLKRIDEVSIHSRFRLNSLYEYELTEVKLCLNFSNGGPTRDAYFLLAGLDACIEIIIPGSLATVIANASQ